MTIHAVPPSEAIHRRPPYDRRRDLAPLLPLWPTELDDLSPAGRRRVTAKLARALRHDRRAGLAGAWAYDLARHRALLRAWRAEQRGGAPIGTA
jgi:hypothetical protein